MTILGERCVSYKTLRLSSGRSNKNNRVGSVAGCNNQKVDGYAVATWTGLLQHGLAFAERSIAKEQFGYLMLASRHQYWAGQRITGTKRILARFL